MSTSVCSVGEALFSHRIDNSRTLDSLENVCGVLCVLSVYGHPVAHWLVHGRLRQIEAGPRQESRGACDGLSVLLSVPLAVSVFWLLTRRSCSSYQWSVLAGKLTS